MREILVLNPSTKAAGRGKRKGPKMARKKGKKKAARKKYRRKNPTAKRYVRRAASRLTSGLSIKTALKDQIPIQIGMLGAQWAAKRFGPEANELDAATWSWASYAKGAAGAFGAGVLLNMVKPGLGQKALTGGLAHVVHRLLRNELIERSPWAIAQFGEDEEGIYVDDDGTPYAASGGDYLPLDEQHRMLPSGSVGELVPVNELGDSLVTPGPLGASDDFSKYAEAYNRV